MLLRVANFSTLLSTLESSNLYLRFGHLCNIVLAMELVVFKERFPQTWIRYPNTESITKLILYVHQSSYEKLTTRTLSLPQLAC